MAEREPVTKTVEFHPPTSEDIHRYAGEVCRELGLKVDANLDSPEFRRELAGFIQIVASICSKYMTKDDNPLDNDN